MQRNIDNRTSDVDDFGLARLRSTLLAQCDSAQHLLRSVLQSVEVFRQQRPLADDLTLVAVQLNGAQALERPMDVAAAVS